ncbi:unnamed protein product [Cyclocybe aegerita]|uniref:Uncharacterized protein n=1 Tax=Cyclocybe aegerita TaxID=1973307 RepID=A0A8S0X1J0_CYCAE|nr:unnamed protein product [Cyclocybe aegerita]
MPPEERAHEDYWIMWHPWVDIICANTTEPSWIGKEGLGREFQQFCIDDSHTISWALVFTCQMHVDSVHIRRRHLQGDFQTMRDFAEKITQSYDSYLPEEEPAQGQAYVQEKLDSARTSIRDWLLNDALTQSKEHSGWEKYKGYCDKNSIWLLNLWLTANAISGATVRYFRFATFVIQHDRYVQSIHLWNMLKQTGHLAFSTTVVRQDLATEDILLLDHLVEAFSEKVFLGPPPKRDFFKSWELSMGALPENYAQGKRAHKKTTPRPSNPRLRKMAHNLNHDRGSFLWLSDAVNLHYANFSNALKEDYARRRLCRQEWAFSHPLAVTLDLVNSEFGATTSAPPLAKP